MIRTSGDEIGCSAMLQKRMIVSFRLSLIWLLVTNAVLYIQVQVSQGFKVIYQDNGFIESIAQSPSS